MKKIIFILVTAFFSLQELSWASSFQDSQSKNNDRAITVDDSQPNAGTNQTANNTRDNNHTGSEVAQFVSTGLMIASISPVKICGTGTGAWACPVAAMLIGMAGTAHNQSGINSDYSGFANETSKQTGQLSSFGDQAKPLTSQIYKGDAQNIFNKLTSAQGLNGTKLDPKTGVITTADGKSYKPSSFSSAAAMKAAGISDSDIKGALSKAEKLEKEALDKLKKNQSALANSGYDEGGGGGSSLNSASAPGSEGAGVGALGGINSRNKLARNPAAHVAGLSKNYNGEPIGVAQDSIFLMMNRRYKIKEKQDSFFEMGR